METMDMSLEKDPIEMISGLPTEIDSKLRSIPKNRRVMLVTIDAPIERADAFERALKSFVTLIDASIVGQSKKAVADIVRAVTPTPAIPANMLRLMKMQARGRRMVIESSEWLKASELATRTEKGQANPSAQPNKWKRDKKIFAIDIDGVDYFPDYGLDEKNGFRPVPGLEPIIRLLSNKRDGWGIAYWFVSPNGYLRGKRPLDLIKTAPEKVFEAAKNEAVGVMHG